MGNSDNRKRGVNSRQNEKNREALIAVLTVCLIGVLVTVVIIAAVDLYGNTPIRLKSIHLSTKLLK